MHGTSLEDSCCKSRAALACVVAGRESSRLPHAEAGLRGFGFRVPRQTGKIQIEPAHREPAHREVDEADHATLREVMCNGSENPIRKEW
jgi:hypothetical protein